jgi:methylmalonyl-CoA/ethylmalonyl-CoA epimerase
MKFHHVGYATASIQESLKVFLNIGYHLSGDLIIDKHREILIQFIEDEKGHRIELIEDLPDSNSRLIGKVLNVRSGSYHLAYETPRISNRASTLGLRQLGKCEPADAFLGHHVAFFVGKDGALFEFISTEPECDHP